MRNSNIEILRIVAMFLILMLHVNFFSIGEPSVGEARTEIVSTFFRCFFESVSLISVNLYVLISGWFSIKFNFQRLAGFIFQSVFIITVVYIIGVILGKAQITELQLEECLIMGRYGWFIKAYIGLYLLSPVLNYYTANASEQEFRYLLISLFTFQFIYACVTLSADFIVAGYSTFSFAALYLLAQYVKRHGKVIIENAGRIFILSIIGYVIWGYVPVLLGVMRIFYMSLHYTNPFNILAALSLLLIAVRAKPRVSAIINYIAASTFAVYLCHMCNTWTATLYKQISIDLYDQYSGLLYLLNIGLFITTVFIVSILIDQPRKIIWKSILNGFQH